MSLDMRFQPSLYGREAYRRLLCCRAGRRSAMCGIIRSRTNICIPEEFLEGQIMIALGGAAAEEMFYGERSTGSRGDFEQAMSIVRSMVESGLTELGIIDGL